MQSIRLRIVRSLKMRKTDADFFGEDYDEKTTVFFHGRMLIVERFNAPDPALVLSV